MLFRSPSQKIIWHNPYSELHYLYTRSFYVEQQPLSDTIKKATNWYIETAKKDWLSYSLYEKGLAALTLNRFGEKDTAKKIIESLKETASNNEDWGMYWIANKAGWYWHQAPIETQPYFHFVYCFLVVFHFGESLNEQSLRFNRCLMPIPACFVSNPVHAPIFIVRSCFF